MGWGGVCEVQTAVLGGTGGVLKYRGCTVSREPGITLKDM